MRLASRRCLWLLAGLAGAALLGLILALSLVRVVPGRVNRANFAKIRPGMTKEQVDALLGAEHLWGWGQNQALVSTPAVPIRKGDIFGVAHYAEFGPDDREVLFLVRVELHNGRVVGAETPRDDYYDSYYLNDPTMRHRYFRLYFNRLRRRLGL